MITKSKGLRFKIEVPLLMINLFLIVHVCKLCICVCNWEKTDFSLSLTDRGTDRKHGDVENNCQT